MGFPYSQVAKLWECSLDLVSWEQGAGSRDSPRSEEEGREEDEEQEPFLPPSVTKVKSGSAFCHFPLPTSPNS